MVKRKLIIAALGIAIYGSIFASSVNNKSTNLAENMEIIIIRHGEKVGIDHDHGVLNCQGINRSLLLPKFLKDNYNGVDKIYAPKPFYTDKYNHYSIRPLETVLPSATYFNTGVNLGFEVEDTSTVAKDIIKSENESKKILVAWRHDEINDIASSINSLYGGSCSFDKWKGKDFDSVYELTIKDGQISCKKKFENLTEKADKPCPYIQ